MTCAQKESGDSQLMKNLFVSLLMTTALLGQAAAQSPVPVTPVSGESWLSHLHRPLEQTSMGKTGRLGPATIVPGRQAAEQNWAIERLGYETAKQSVIVQGADLYRL